jgi:hypothetical protein
MDEETKIASLKEYFSDAEEIERDESSDCYGLEAYNVDGDIYIVGTYEECYDAAVEEAKQTFDDCYSDSDKVDWLQKWNWPGVDVDSVLSACSDDEYEYSDIDEYIEMFGDKASDAFSISFLKPYIDMRELGEFVVDTDGIANGLARYDGNEIDLPNDLLAFRVE